MPSKALTTDKTRAYSTSTSFNLTVLISGNGSNLQALIDACGQNPSSPKSQYQPTLPYAHVSHVVSNRREAHGLERAKQAHIPTSYLNLLEYKKKHPDSPDGVRDARAQYDADLAQVILTHIPCPDLVICAGWMHILSPAFVRALDQANVPIINLHPALPGRFNGANAIGRAYEAFQRGEISSTGVMVHYVIDEVDMGQPIVVKEVECRKGESQAELEERIHAAEWRLIVEGTGQVLHDLEDKRRKET